MPYVSRARFFLISCLIFGLNVSLNWFVGAWRGQMPDYSEEAILVPAAAVTGIVLAITQGPNGGAWALAIAAVALVLNPTIGMLQLVLTTVLVAYAARV